MKARRLSRCLCCVWLTLLAACDDMTVQPKQTAYGPEVGPAAIPAGMIAFGSSALQTTPPLSRELMARGRERYRIFCAPCHAELGDGRGMIVQRGFPAPPSFHTDALRALTPQQVYDAVSNGYGVMYSFADRIAPEDRWAIVAYVRALERSQNASPHELASTVEAP
jgi:mono/diheme cytochrome c family protein